MSDKPITHAWRFAAALLPLPLLVWHAWTYRFLTDDAFISFRYVRNLIEGHGLVFNIGERVEGYSNFLWVLELAALWKMGMRPEFASVVLSALLTVGTVAIVVLWARETPFSGRRGVAVFGTLLILAGNRSFAMWTSGGLETRQFTFLFLLGLWLLRQSDAGRTRLAFASAAFGLAALTRPEGQMVGALCLGVAMFAQRREALRWISLALPFAMIIGAHLAFRRLHYGDWVPNTYHAKFVRAWPEAGAAYLLLAALECGLLFLWPLSIAGARARFRRAAGGARDIAGVAALVAMAAHLAYLLVIGGDHFEFRPLDFHWPVLAVLAVDGLLAFEVTFNRRFSARAGLRGSFAGLALAALVLPHLFVLQIAIRSTELRLTGRDQTLRHWTAITPDRFLPPYLLPGIGPLMPLHNRVARWCVDHSVATRWIEHREFWAHRSAMWAPYEALHGRGVIPSDAVTVAGSVGIMAFHLPEVTVIDAAGLTDRHIAQLAVTRPNAQRQLAHDRDAPASYLRERGFKFVICPPVPDVRTALRVAPFALLVGEDLWLSFDAVETDWMLDRFEGQDVRCDGLLTDGPVTESWVLRDGWIWQGTRSLGHFDEGTEGWTLRGDAMADQPRAREVGDQRLVMKQVGGGLLNSYHSTHGSAATGEAVSPPFIAEPDTLLVFLLGGEGEQSGVELLANGDVIAQWPPSVRTWLGWWVLERREFDLGPHAGRSLQLRVFDGDDGESGFVLADHFTLMTRLRAHPEATASVFEKVSPR
jgi:arabinofuranosyltransferase